MINFNIFIFGIDVNLFDRIGKSAFLSNREASRCLNAGCPGLFHQIHGFFTGKYASGA